MGVTGQGINTVKVSPSSIAPRRGSEHVSSDQTRYVYTPDDVLKFRASARTKREKFQTDSIVSATSHSDDPCAANIGKFLFSAASLHQDEILLRIMKYFPVVCSLGCCV